MMAIVSFLHMALATHHHGIHEYAVQGCLESYIALHTLIVIKFSLVFQGMTEHCSVCSVTIGRICTPVPQFTCVDLSVVHKSIQELENLWQNSYSYSYPAWNFSCLKHLFALSYWCLQYLWANLNPVCALLICPFNSFSVPNVSGHNTQLNFLTLLFCYLIPCWIKIKVFFCFLGDEGGVGTCDVSLGGWEGLDICSAWSLIFSEILFRSETPANFSVRLLQLSVLVLWWSPRSKLFSITLSVLFLLFCQSV